MTAPGAGHGLLVDGDLAKARTDLDALRVAAKELEATGYTGATVAEAGHDPFLPLVAAADHTSALQVGTAIAVAFARTPMTVAYTAYDMAQLTKGRFFLGLGSQVKAHIERRYSMPWSHPGARMREFVLAMRTIWDSWEHGTKLAFEGEFYRHSLMSPFFAPKPSPYGPPPVFVAAVGELMTEVCGEVADGMLVHGFTTATYIKERTLPALERGRAKSGRSAEGFQLALPVLTVTGDTEAEMAAAKKAVRERIGFYGSTPSYKGVFEIHGWFGLQEELNVLAKQGEWEQMGTLIEDDVLETFAIVAEPAKVAGAIMERYGELVHRISFYAPYESRAELWPPIVADLVALRTA